MKLLISTSYYSPHISGLTNSIKNLAEVLSKEKYDITILTTQYQKNISEREIINNVNVVRVPYLFKVSKGFFMPSLFFFAYKSIKNTDQVIVNLPQFEGFIVAFIAKIMNKKVHCIYACEVVFEKNIWAEIAEKFLRFSSKICLSLADTVITLTEDFANNNSTLIKQNKKIHAIFPVIISPKILLYEKEKLKRKIPKKKYLIGFIGRIAAEKGVEYLLNAIPMLQAQIGNDFVIVIAGPKHVIGEETYFKKITKLSERHKNNIVILGELKQNELGAFYDLLDILVLPSTNNTEAFGMVQAEAMLCGTPVVVTNLPGVRVLVQITGMGELAEPKNSYVLAEKIVKVLNNRKDFIKNKHEIEEYFNKTKIIKECKEIFNN